MHQIEDKKEVCVVCYGMFSLKKAVILHHTCCIFHP